MQHSLRTRLLLSHLAIVGLMVIVLAVGVAGFFRLGRSVNRILQNNYRSVVAAQDMKEALERMDSAATFYVAEQTDRARKQFAENEERFRAALKVELGNVTEDGEQRAADELGRDWETYRGQAQRLLDGEAGTNPSGYYFGTLEPQFRKVKSGAETILRINQDAIVRADENAREEARLASLASVVVALLAGIGAVIFASRVSGALMTPLVSLTRQASEVGAGHLNQRIETRRTDEIGTLAQTFNDMAARLREARQASETRLHRAERMSDAALGSLYDPVVVTDAEGTVLHLNRAAEGLFGPDKQARGKSVREVVSEGRLADAIERAFRTGRTAHDGEETQQFGARTYRLRVSPMREGDKTLLGAVAVLEDVTRQTELDRLKTEFIGVASHELRTPVTSLILGVQLLNEGAAGPLTDGQREITGALERDLTRLDRMTRDLLDMTRLEAGAMPPRFEQVAAHELAEQARQATQAQAKQSSVTVTLDVPQGLPPVRADRSQIQRVLVNLLGNALRHTASGGSVTISAAESGGAVRFEVTDTGAGIPAQYLNTIWERFAQVPGATGGGSGLGLSLVQQIIVAHGGTVGVESEPGQGSRFWFTLPTGQEQNAPKAGKSMTGANHGANLGN